MINKKVKNTTSGITLISLVVTIIILIILAGISINLLLGENGIIKRGSNASMQMDIAWEKEMIELAKAQMQIENNGDLLLEKVAFQKAIIANSGTNEITVDGNNLLLIVTFQKSNRQYEVYPNGSIEDAAPKTEDTTPDTIATKDENTYLIQSIEDLVILSKAVSDGESYEGKTFEIVSDLNFQSTQSYIDANQTNFLGLGDINKNGTVDSLLTELTTGFGFIPIGNSTTPFKGSIQGNEHIIRGLYVSSINEAGLIAVGSNNTIENLNLLNVNIKSYSSCAGAILGKMLPNSTIIRNCRTSGEIRGNNCSSMIGLASCYSSDNDTIIIENSINEANITGSSGFIGRIEDVETVTLIGNKNMGNLSGSLIGGMFGNGYGIENALIENCENYGNINATGSGCAGIVGEAGSITNVTIRKCINTGNITGAARIGGIYSNTSIGTGEFLIEDCYNTGNLSSTNDTYEVGGIAGDIDYRNSSCSPVTIRRCYNTGKISGGCYVGGIIGYDEPQTTIEECYNTGDVKGKRYVGGIVGQSPNPNLTIIKSYNIGPVEAEKQYLGGIVSYCGSITLTDVYNSGIVKAIKPDESFNIGGLIGYSYGTYSLTNCYNSGNIEASDFNSLGGIIGYSSGDVTITNAYEIGNIIIENQTIDTENIGGIIGYGYNPTLENTYYLSGISTKGVGNKNLDGVNVVENKSKDVLITLMNQNLSSDIWEQRKNGEYPGLKNI